MLSGVAMCRRLDMLRTHANGNKLAKPEHLALKLKLREHVATRFAEAGASEKMGPDRRSRPQTVRTSLLLRATDHATRAAEARAQWGFQTAILRAEPRAILSPA